MKQRFVKLILKGTGLTLIVLLSLNAFQTSSFAIQPSVATGRDHTVGLRSDGTVVAVGYSSHGETNVGSWTDIVQVAAGYDHTVGVKSDGMVVAVGYNGYGQTNVGSWTDIVRVAAGVLHTVGVKSDGTVLAVGDNDLGQGQTNVGSWTDIVEVAAGNVHTVGLRSNGTVVAVGKNTHGQTNVGSWTDIVQVAAGNVHTVGLRSNGTVVAVGDNINVNDWTGIVQVAAGHNNTVGVKSDGTVLAVGYNYFGQNNLFNWNLNEKDSLKKKVEDFVIRFYQLCLNRNPDQTGLDVWVAALLNGTQTGSDVASGFVLSQEFTNKNTTDEEYISILYEAFFNRTPDSAGLQGWLDAIANGASRVDVLNGFIYAAEFAKLCDDYGIIAFREVDPKESLIAFVTRFYQLCLDRDPDAEGLEGWADNLLNQIQTGADVANGFIFSPEFINKNTTNDEYLTILYKAFFNRDPDQSAWDIWVAELNGGKDRGYVLNGFLGSQEFIKLCQDYGIKPN